MNFRTICVFGRELRVYPTGDIANKSGAKLKSRISNKGYLIIDINISGRSRKHLKVHRLVAQAFIPNLDQKYAVNHIDFDKLNNNVENLEWSTCRENILHSLHKDPKFILHRDRPDQRGSKNKSSKLAEYQVFQIREKLTSGQSLRFIASQFNVSPSTILSIKSGKNWSHLVKQHSD